MGVPVGGWKEGGLIACIGRPGTGKTTRAVIEQRTIAADLVRRGLPGICVTMDCGHSASYIGQPRTSNVDEVIYDVWKRRVHPKIWSPPIGCSDAWCRHGRERKNPAPPGCAVQARNKFWEHVRTRGGVNLIVDDIQVISEDRPGSGSYTHVDPAMVRLSVMIRHGSVGPNYIWLAAQKPTFIPPKLRHAVIRAEVFQVQTEDVETVHAWYGCGRRCDQAPCVVAPSIVTKLRRGEHVSIRREVQD